MLEKIKESASFLKGKVTINPKIGIVLGSGLGGLVDQVEIITEIPYKDIPNFPVSTVAGHRGSLIFGKLNNVEVMVMSGRFHYYEGYKMKEVTFPIQVMKAMGVEKLILSNAAGGMNPTFKIGDIMIIKDHINLFGDNPLMGKNYDELGPRFPSMNEAYSKRLVKLAHETGKKLGIYLQQGVYLGVTGPCFETPAEYRAFYILGADAVGMSTVPEVLAANHCGIKTAGISCITNMAAGILDTPLNHKEVMETADRVKESFSRLIRCVIERI